ncbi:hypothetical protein JZ751_020676 [Albula glossodonta]|uniref:Uncharacterized protein n=1 Tax=Albula glossodonta TaxID=121402 RepID=A0A8T2PG03_9TELE|nr:hypothetical protein JZ751_020676 [Albula glossodonta]
MERSGQSGLRQLCGASQGPPLSNRATAPATRSLLRRYLHVLIVIITKMRDAEQKALSDEVMPVIRCKGQRKRDPNAENKPFIQCARALLQQHAGGRAGSQRSLCWQPSKQPINAAWSQWNLKSDPRPSARATAKRG